MNIVILGVPGSGKGTQSKLLEKKLELRQLSTGEILRSEVRSETEIGRRIQRLMHSGKLVSDEIMIELISNCLDQSTINKGVIFDGFMAKLHFDFFVYFYFLGSRRREPPRRGHGKSTSTPP